jgi:hypothetical protein
MNPSPSATFSGFQLSGILYIPDGMMIIPCGRDYIPFGIIDIL